MFLRILSLTLTFFESNSVRISQLRLLSSFYGFWLGAFWLCASECNIGEVRSLSITISVSLNLCLPPSRKTKFLGTAPLKLAFSRVMLILPWTACGVYKELFLVTPDYSFSWLFLDGKSLLSYYISRSDIFSKSLLSFSRVDKIGVWLEVLIWGSLCSVWHFNNRCCWFSEFCGLVLCDCITWSLLVGFGNSYTCFMISLVKMLLSSAIARASVVGCWLLTHMVISSCSFEGPMIWLSYCLNFWSGFLLFMVWVIDFSPKVRS